ncbi:immunoglobulin-like domain-containing protein [Carnobacterium gallinarum]|uniref:immunoglobulin-like domain-containing protein n=1 Tax=Carnobacterium gallinarum TaxID=2749 RepID=UPI00068F85D3|nr:immunoglobulin-like domain-containing protein [Carnobacterium gallinarum]
MINLKLLGIGTVLCCGITLGQLNADAATLDGPVVQGTTLESYLPNQSMMQESAIQSLMEDPQGAELSRFVTNFEISDVVEPSANYLSSTNHVTTRTKRIRVKRPMGYIDDEFILFKIDGGENPDVFCGREENGYIYFDVRSLQPGKYELQGTTIKPGALRLLVAFDVKLASNEVPVITAPDRTIEVGSVFDALKGVTAKDKEDGVLTNIQVKSNNVDTTKVGDYEVYYEVTDSDGGVGKATAKITVIPKNNLPVITAPDRTLEVGSEFDALAGVTAFDEEDGKLTDIRVEHTNVNMQKPGKYQVGYEVTDSKGAIGRATANITVIKRNELPVITAPDRTIQVGSKFNPLEGVTAYDKEDGFLRDIRVEFDNVDTATPGEYIVRYEVTDSDGGVGKATAKITVIKRNELPVITAPDRTIRVGSKFNPLEGVTAYDKEDGFLRDIRVEFDGVNTAIPGEYIVRYEVTDSDGGVGKATAKITVIYANELPVITAPDRTIEVGSEFKPLEGVTAYDKEDGVLTNTQVISDNVNVDVPGVYEVRYQVVDSDNGIGTATAKITVVKGELEMPVIFEMLDTDRIVKGTGEKNTTLYLKIGNDYFEEKVESNGTFTVVLESSYAAGTVIEGYLKDSEGRHSKTYKGIVIATDRLSINRVTTADSKISGLTIPNAIVEVRVTTLAKVKVYKGKSDASGNFKINFTQPYSLGTPIEVTVINPFTGHKIIKTIQVVTP